MSKYFSFIFVQNLNYFKTTKCLKNKFLVAVGWKAEGTKGDGGNDGEILGNKGQGEEVWGREQRNKCLQTVHTFNRQKAVRQFFDA